MACLTKRQEHQRDRASNIVIETGYVVRRCRKLPRDYVIARISVAIQINDTLQQASRIGAEYSHASSYECESAQREQWKIGHCL